MKIPLTDRQKQYISILRQQQLANRAYYPHASDFFCARNVVCLMSRMGSAVYLDFDGRLYVANSNNQ